MKDKAKVRMLNGYRLILDPTNPKAMKGDNWRGYVYEHISVAEKFLGRDIGPNEIVHHLDGDRSNNRIGNLLVLDNGQHLKLHKWLRSDAPRSDNHREIGHNLSCCKRCGKTLQNKQIKYCSTECYNYSIRRTGKPSKEQLLKDINDMSWVAVGRKYGVTDNAVRKWARRYGLL